jgi:hypothetical protein
VIRPAVGSSSRVSSRPVVDLPQPDSPTSPKLVARVHGQVDAVDRLDGAHLPAEGEAAHDREVLGQLLGDQEGFRFPRRARLDAHLNAAP